MGLDRHSGLCTLHAHSCYPGTVYDAESTETPLDLKSLLGLLSQRQTPAVQSTLFDASHIAACSILADPNGTQTQGVLSFSYISFVSFTQIHLIASIFLCAEFGRI